MTRTSAEWIPLIDDVLSRKSKSLLNVIAEDIWRQDNSHTGPPSATPKDFAKGIQLALNEETNHFHLAPVKAGRQRSQRWMNLRDFNKPVGEAAVDDIEEGATEESSNTGILRVLFY